MNLELNNKVVILTGATGGIGRAIAEDFLKEGSIVVCLIRNEEKMKTLKSELIDKNVAVEHLHSEVCNLLDYKSMSDAVKTVVQKYKAIDVLVNCAGYADEFPFALMDEDQISKMIDFNLKSPMLLSHAVLRTMFKQKSGSIINISSASAVKKGRGIVSYASAKAGIEALTRTLASEVGRKNIRVNCIRPGLIKTPMSDAVLFRLEEQVSSTTSLGRPGSPSEISKMVLVVASEKVSSYMTGECLTIDGGII
jgi:3-oxoacyl-[acyl-carrier protein] reductase